MIKNICNIFLIILIIIFLFSIFVTRVFSNSINDPTKPIYIENSKKNIIKNKDKSNTIIVESIFFGKKNKIVVIDGQILHEGSTILNFIKDFHVLSIHKNHVLIKHEKNIKKIFIFNQLK